MTATTVIRSVSPMQRERALSDFDLCLMPDTVARTPLPWSVHRSATTNKFICTLTLQSKNRLQIPFVEERVARKFAKAFAPPKFLPKAACACGGASHKYCRNCGASVCETCLVKWSVKMVPKTFVSIKVQTVRVCKSCDWLSNAFCMALLQGRSEDAVRLYETGNINLRTAFADIRKEAMFPVHCAVLGGSLPLVQWLVDQHLCPIVDGQNRSVQTSSNRTLIDMAMAKARPRVDILGFLIRKGLDITDVRDKSLIPNTLQAILKHGIVPSASAPVDAIVPQVISEDDVTTLDGNACALCCEKSMDCVLTPCGHQICCTDCGHQLTSCPVCKADCNVLRIFRQ